MNKHIRRAALVFLTVSLTQVASATTIRVGEQDSCTVTGVTTVAGHGVTFDLSGVKGAGEVTSAKLRMWVTVGVKDSFGRNFTMANWDKPDFDGFKVRDEAGKVLDTVYPFYQTVACHEWNVTEAVKGKPGAGKVTLKTNFPLPPNDSGQAWKRVYLEITTTGEDADRPKQPTELKAKYRSGQVFLTWKQIPFDGAFFDSTYRIYKHNAPITAANLADATLVGEVNKNSQLNYRRTAYSYGGLTAYGTYSHFWQFIPIETDSPKDKTKNLNLLHAKLPKRFNFVIDEDWPKSIQDGKWLEDSKLLGDGASMPQGPGLSDDTGLFVHTAAKDENAFFAVTSVIRGNENRSDFAANALATPMGIKKDTPKPILQVVYNMGGRGGYQFREYVLWGGPQEGLHNEPSTPFMFHNYVKGDNLQSLRVGALHTNSRGSDAGFDRSYMPPTRLAPFPVLHCSLNYGGSLSRPDREKSFWIHGDTFYRPAAKASESGNYGFGFPVFFGVAGLHRADDNCYGYHDLANTGKDPRKAMVVPYFQNRALKAIEIFCADFPQVDRNRTMFTGQGDAFLMGVHHSDIFAAVGANQFSPWSAKRVERLWEMVGKREWALKNEQGVEVWNWNDPIWQSKKYPKKVWSYISVCQSPNYDKADDFSNWQNMGYPKFYLDLQEEKRGGRWWWVDIGDAPDSKAGLVPMNQAYPAFTKVNFCETPQMKWKKEPRGTLNGYLSFGPNGAYLRSIRRDQALTAKMREGMKTVDTLERFEMAFRIGDHGLRNNGAVVPPTVAKYGKTDITMWRLQQFKIASGKKYRWINKKVATDQVLQTGVITPDDRDLLTIPGFFVDRDATGNKLIITAEGGSPAEIVDADTPVRAAFPPSDYKAAPKVVDLTYADYVKACENPVTSVMVKLPSTTFKISEFTQAGKCSADGEYTQRGGGFGSYVATALNIPKDGHYVMTLRAKGEKGKAGNWPVVQACVGGRYGVKHKPRIIDTEDYGEYRWYGNLEEGKLDIQLVTPSIYYNLHALPTLAEGRIATYKDFTFTYIPEADTQKPVEIRVSPQGIAVPAGMSTRMTARVLNGLGKPLDTKVTWKCEGAEISADGILKAAAPGTCTVTASAAGLEAKVAVQIAENFNEHFNEGCGTLRSGWLKADLGKSAGTWGTPDRGHHMLNSLQQSSRKPVKSMLLWDHGTPWSNYEIQADMVIMNAPDGVRGLVVCAKDKDNHIRMEIRHKGSETVAAIIKRKGGTDSVLAENKTAPAYQPFDWKTNPMCPGWHNKEDMNVGGMKMDRMRVQVKDGELRAWVADTELFPDGVKDADIGAGTIGLYSENACSFDNVVVKAGK